MNNLKRGFTPPRIPLIRQLTVDGARAGSEYTNIIAEQAGGDLSNHRHNIGTGLANNGKPVGIEMWAKLAYAFRKKIY